jgi:hypothetical protein
MHQTHQVVVMSLHFPVSAPMGFRSSFMSLLLAVIPQHHQTTSPLHPQK